MSPRSSFISSRLRVRRASARSRALAAAAWLLIATGSPDASLAGPPADDSSLAAALTGERHSVSARLLAEVSALAAGHPFWVGIEITMAPGWHTYWRNGGDAGLPTTVAWDLPAGFTAGELHWPLPKRVDDETGLVTFDYSEKVMLLSEITPPGELPGELGSVTLRAHVEWLQCKDACIPGEARVSLDLPVAATPEPAPEETRAAFAATRELIPTPASSVPGLLVQAFQKLDAIAPGDSTELAIVVAGLESFGVAGSEFFPHESESLWFRDAFFRGDGENLAIIIPVTADETTAAGSMPLLAGDVRIAREDGGDPWLLTVAAPLVIAEPGQLPQPTYAAVFQEGARNFLAGAPAAGPATAAGRALWRYLLLAFVGGIILNVMPCVLPVVSLKILGFVSHAEHDERKIFRLGLTFAAGVLASFLALALIVVILQAAGEHVGWGFQFQSPFFVAALAAVIFLFSLSLLGVFEIDILPLLGGLGAGASVEKPYVDAFFHGILATILATPCTAPMLGTAVAFAFSQPPAAILAIFLAVGLGLALPYVLLASHPRWLRFVPKPGPWMETFKQAMGFVLLATLVWLLSVFGAQTGAEGLTWLIAFLLVLAFFAWLHGRFLTLGASRIRVLAIWLVTLLGLGLSYRTLLHEHLLISPGEGATAIAAETTEGGILWAPFSEEALASSLAAGKTVFVDFTAEWCWTCKVNEKTVLEHTEVEDEFRRLGVVTLKGDWTRKDPVITRILNQHGRAGVPFYAIYPAGRPDDVIVLPELINRKLVLDSLREAGPSLDQAA